MISLGLMFAKGIIIKAIFINLFDFTKNIIAKQSIRPDIRPLPDIRNPAFGLAGYPAVRISVKNSIRCIPIVTLE
jgi:hypothetical protein